ncbi:MAG: DUF4157 domain-containing protein [Leptolyngbyaceae cyanobacterium SL_7_1]|nr:DUF4157 domain-containing protein [Leptolyngbyaceae cyanobacterium SL_7_1]
MVRSRFDPGMISLYPADPFKEERREKPIQKQAAENADAEEKDKPIQRKSEETPEKAETKEQVQRKSEVNEVAEKEPIQTKLSVGKPGDRYEQEADQVAAKVMTMPDPTRNRIQRQTDDSDIQPKSLANTITPLVQRQSSDEEVQTKSGQARSAQDQSVNTEFENRLSSSKIGGSPLPGDVRSFMEPRFGVDLSHVRVHTGADSAQMNKDVRAQAFTYRNHVFYAAGKSPGKDDLTAHELTHVIQQTGGKLKQAVRRSPDENDSIQPKSLEPNAIETEKNKLTPAEASIQRHDISMVSPRIQRNVVTDLIGAGGDLLTGDVEGARRRLLNSVSSFASGMPGYPLLTVILGKDPIKDQPVERNATNVVRGVLSLAPNGEQLFQNLQESGALQKGFDWFEKELRRLNITWNTIKALFRRAIDALSPDDILNPGGLIEEIVNIFRAPIQRITRFALAVGQKVMEFVFEGAMALAGKGGANRVMGILKKIGGLFMKIVKDPIGFIGNLVRAVQGGFQKFSGNIMTHLRAGLVGWLFGALSGSGLQIPAKFDMKGILSLGLQVIGATYQKLRAKLVRRLGEKKVSQVEKAFALLRTIVSGGIMAAWQQIAQHVGNIQEMVMGAIRQWVITQVVRSAIIKLVSMFNPAGAVVQAVIAIYNTVMFFVERMQQIMELANSVFNSVNKIAAGDVGGASKSVEQSMGRSLPVIISFLARLMGLGGISKKIRDIIKRVQRPIDRAFDRIVGMVMKFAKKLSDRDKNGKSNDRTESQKEEIYKGH